MCNFSKPAMSKLPESKLIGLSHCREECILKWGRLLLHIASVSKTKNSFSILSQGPLEPTQNARHFLIFFWSLPNIFCAQKTKLSDFMELVGPLKPKLLLYTKKIGGKIHGLLIPKVTHLLKYGFVG